MEEKIIDNFEEQPRNKTTLNRLVQIFVASVFLFFMLEKLRGILPENVLDRDGVQVKTIGLFIVGLVVINSILIPTYLNKIKPKLTKIKVVIYTGLMLLAIEIFFKLMQNLLVSNNLNLDYLQVLRLGAIVSGFGMLIANIRIHKLRNKKILIPVLLLIGAWIGIGFILKK